MIPENKIIVKKYLVAYIDILGQKDILPKMNELPTNKIESDKYQELVNKSYSRIIEVKCFI